jgi:hypothetical protein
MNTCGFCGGSGIVANRQADRYGPRPDYPAQRVCEYCGGSGQWEDGDKLLLQGPVYQATDEDRQRAGLPPWA